MPPALLHLSDVQFGRNNRYEGDDAPQILLSRLCDDLEILRSRLDFNVCGVLITGDIAETGSPHEYEQALAFLQGLINNLNLEVEQVGLTAGNHDVNRLLCEAGRLKAAAFGELYKPPYFEKFSPFKQFYDKFYAGVRVYDETMVSVHDWSSIGVVVAGVNSCVMESELPEEHYGWVGHDQMQRVLTGLEQVDPENKHLRILMVHHNFLCRSDLDNENLRDADLIRPLVDDAHISVILHGHRHISGVEQIRNPVTGSMQTVIGAGSAGLDGSVLPDHPNQYGIIVINRNDSIELISRQFSTQTIGGSGRGKWISDTSISENGRLSISVKENMQQRYSETPKATASSEKFIGRTIQVQQIHDLLNRVRDGDGAALFVEGELGIGKTSLIKHFCAQHRDDVLFVWGRYPSYSSTGASPAAYYGVRQVIRRLLGFSAVDSSIQTTAAHDALTNLGVASGSAETLSRLIGDELSDSSIEDTDRFKERIIACINEFLGHLSTKKPLLVLLDDIQWADGESLNFIQRFIEFIRDGGLPILLVCNFRPEGRAYNANLRKTLGMLTRFSHDPVFSQALPPLTIEEISELARTIQPKLSDGAVREIFDRSRGNPFFAIELARTDSLLSGDKTTLSGEKAGNLHGSLDAIFENRLLDLYRVEDGELLARMLLLLSRLGGEATLDEIRAGCSLSSRATTERLVDRLTELGFVEGAGDDQKELFQFSYNILSEVVRTFVPKSFSLTEDEVCKAIAAALDSGKMSRPPAFAAEIYAHIGDHRQSAIAFEKAASAAFRFGDFETAESYVAEGLKAANQCQDTTSEAFVIVDLRLLMARIMERTGRYFDALSELQDIKSRVSADRLTLAKGDLLVGVIYTRTGEWEAAKKHFEEMWNAREHVSNEEALIVTLYYASAMYVMCENIPKALCILEEAAREPAFKNTDALMGRVLAHISIFSYETGNIGKARQYLGLARRRFSKCNSSIDLGLLEITYGNLAFDEGDFPRARQHFEAACEKLFSVRCKFGHATATLNLCFVEYSLDNVEVGLERCQNAEEMFTELNLDHGVGQALLGRAWGYALQGKSQEATDCAREAEALFQISNTVDPRDIGIAKAIIAYCYDTDAKDKAILCYTDAMDRFAKARDARRYVLCLRNVLALSVDSQSEEIRIKTVLENAARQDWMEPEWRVKVSDLRNMDRGELDQFPVFRMKPNA